MSESVSIAGNNEREAHCQRRHAVGETDLEEAIEEKAVLWRHLHPRAHEAQYK